MRENASKDIPKILLVGPMPPLIGGIATYISDLLNSNLNEKFKLIPFATNRPSNKNKVPSSHNFEVIMKLSPPYLFKCLVITVYHLSVFPIILAKNKPDLVHIHTASYWSFLENSYYVLISKLFRKKVVIHIHANDFDVFYKDGSFLMKQYIYLIITMANRIVSLSEYWKQFIVNEIGSVGDCTVIIRNGVVSSKYKKQASVINCNDNINILFIGGMDAKRKGAYEVVKAIPAVVSHHSNVTFTFIGRGQIENIKSMCKDMGVEQNVRILGQISEDEKIKHFKCSDIFLLPSYAEGLPISILEAMAAGLPVISTTVGAIPEVVEEGINGYLIEPGDHKSLAEKILLLAQNNDLRYFMKKNNMEKIENYYDTDIVSKKIGLIYQEIIK